jgi:hypothetical protein
MLKSFKKNGQRQKKSRPSVKTQGGYRLRFLGNQFLPGIADTGFQLS